jgi:hypothetical protein
MTHAIAQELYGIQALTGDRFFKLFDDWLALATAALSSDIGKEARYMAVMRRYGPREAGKPHPADHFANALGAFLRDCQQQSAANKRIGDILGTLYETESLANAYSGQFFTPELLAEMTARLMIEPTDAAITIADPACGSGRFFIAAQPLAPNATYYGTDIDETCVRMCALNMLVRNANASIVHGNTLTMECYGGFQIRSSPFGGSMIPLTSEQALHQLTATRQVIATEPTTSAQQSPVDASPTGAAAPGGSPQRPTVITKKGQFDFGF